MKPWTVVFAGTSTDFIAHVGHAATPQEACAEARYLLPSNAGVFFVVAVFEGLHRSHVLPERGLRSRVRA